MIFAFDPGFTGGIAVIDKEKVYVYNMPVAVITKGKKKKTTYDVVEIISIINKHLDKRKKSYAIIEKVSPRPLEGTVSSFNFGRGFGTLIGVMTTLLAQEPYLVIPNTWKKNFPDLNSKEFVSLKQKQKECNSNSREYLSKVKKTKDKALKTEYKNKAKEYKKEADRLGREAKSEAKQSARNYAIKLYPDLSDEFKRVKDDGKSDALLIGLYFRDNLNELVHK